MDLGCTSTITGGIWMNLGVLLQYLEVSEGICMNTTNTVCTLVYMNESWLYRMDLLQYMVVYITTSTITGGILVDMAET